MRYSDIRFEDLPSYEIGLEAGIQRGMKQGLLEGKLESVVYMIKKFGADINEIAKELNISKIKY